MNEMILNRCNTEYFSLLKNTHTEIGDYINTLMKHADKKNITPVILCIGTDRATGDCLGPLVGKKLLDSNCKCLVIGNLDFPVHALNLRQALSNIYLSYDNPYVIAVDASLGSKAHVGKITVANCPISPGKGVNKSLPAVGDISITGIVNVYGKSPALLQSTRLNIVMQLADCIANSLIYAVDSYNYF